MPPDQSGSTMGAEGAVGFATWPVAIGSQEVELPIISIDDDNAIALLMTIDRGVRFGEQVGEDLAARLNPARPEVVVSAATLGIPVAIEVTRHLGLDDYVILQKTPKIHLGEALAEPLASITTTGNQRLLLDPARVAALAGRRVAVVDDVIATGGSMAASLRLVRRARGEVVAIGAVLVEGSQWKQTLGADVALVHSLGAIPGFCKNAGGELTPTWS